MKTVDFALVKYSLIIALVALLVAGCATSTPRITVVSPVGPSTEYGGPQNGQGKVVVYSAYEVSWVGDPDFVHHTRYAICDADGKLVKRVVNFYSDFDPTPVATVLPSGRYIIKARAAKYGLLSIPVVVAANLTTTIFLDGVPHNETRGVDPQKVVTLPKGEIVGWRARE
jgi:hypothetical protein